MWMDIDCWSACFTLMNVSILIWKLFSFLRFRYQTFLRCHVMFFWYLRKILHHHRESDLSVFSFLVFITLCLFITKKRRIINFGFSNDAKAIRCKPRNCHQSDDLKSLNSLIFRKFHSNLSRGSGRDEVV